MAGIYKGVQARVMEVNESAKFVPCLAHSLNLVGVHSASSSPDAISLFGLVQKLYCFFVGSTTRWEIMKQCTKTNLKGSSQTRWSARHLAVTALINNLPEVVEALEKIAESSLSAESKYECSHLLGAVMNFKFILTLIIWSNILREMNRVNVQIQKEDIIISRSVALMQGLIHTISEMREKSIEFWIEEATPVSKKLGIEPILKSKRIPIKKRQHDEKCGDESRTLNATQLVSKEIKIIFDKILTEINTRLESAKDLNENFAFLNGYAFVNMSAEELQKHGELLARTYSRDLNILDFCQELAVFKKQAPLVIGINEKTTAFDLLQVLYSFPFKQQRSKNGLIGTVRDLQIQEELNTMFY
nr:zinc finger MYM-type protein 1-like [Onthophagus taurus]